LETARGYFENVLRVAQWLSEGSNSVNALLALARMVGRQFAYHYSLHKIGPRQRLGEGPALTEWYDLAIRHRIPEEPSSKEQIWLEWDPVIAEPWNGGRLAGARS
jgi:hypothetical protein